MKSSLWPICTGQGHFLSYTNATCVSMMHAVWVHASAHARVSTHFKSNICTHLPVYPERKPPHVSHESVYAFQLNVFTYSAWKCPHILSECVQAYCVNERPCIPSESVLMHSKRAVSMHSTWASTRSMRVSMCSTYVSAHFTWMCPVPSRWNCAHIQSEFPCIQSESAHAFHVNVSIKSRWQNVETIQVSIVFMLSTKHSIHALKVKMVMQATCTSVYGFCVKDGPNVKQYRFQFISINLHKTAKYWSTPSE